MGVIFVGGVHGVGKGTHCKLFSQQCGISWFSASALIVKEMPSAITADKTVAEPTENQDLLLRSVRRLLRVHPTMLLDGHFTVLNSDRRIVCIDTEVFEQLELQGIVVLQDAPSSICERLRERDGHEWSVVEITSFQSTEMAHAKLVAATLGVPLRVVDASDNTGFAKVVESMLH